MSENRKFPQAKVPTPNGLYCQSNGPEPKDTQFTMINTRERQQILTSEKLETESLISSW